MDFYEDTSPDNDDYKQVLYWGDAPSPLVFTGYAKQASNILSYLHSTLKYEIECIGINYFGALYDRSIIPYNVSPARCIDPTDVYGYKAVLHALNRKEYDYLFIFNDLSVSSRITEQLLEIKEKQPNLKIINYYPVDARVIEEQSSIIIATDTNVAYNRFGRVQTMKVFPKANIDFVPHSTNTDLFFPMTTEERSTLKMKYFGAGTDTFVFTNVNRNSYRKDLAKNILAFSIFHKICPKSILYLHTNPKEGPVDLTVLVEQLGLTPQNVRFPTKYDLLSNAFSESTLNEIYNASDCVMTTSLGEGWGLSITEAMNAGTIVLAPKHTSFTEMCKHQRGILYPCTEQVCIDSQGYRLTASAKTIARYMRHACFGLTEKQKLRIEATAYDWAADYDIASVGKEWLDIFKSTTRKKQMVSVASLFD
jgi:hypothetical protein